MERSGRNGIFNLQHGTCNYEFTALVVISVKPEKIWSQLKIAEWNGRGLHTPHTYAKDSGCHHTASTCKALIRDSGI